MSSVTTEVEVIRGITFVVIRGTLSAEVMVNVSKRENYGHTELVCWDLRGADFSQMSREELTKVAEGYKNSDHKRPTRAAVVVLKNDEDLRLFRLYALIGEHSLGRQVPQHLTTRMDEALEWLKGLD